MQQKLTSIFMKTFNSSKPLPASISVVIPNYNGKQLLEANLPSVYAALIFFKDTSEIIIIDDASSDDSVIFIRQHYPDIKLLTNEINKGFSPTVNKGIFASKNELILVLNSDVQLKPDYFNEQLKYFSAADTFGVMGKIIDFRSPNIQDGAKFPKISFKGIKTTYNYIPLKETPETWLPSFFLSGANALIDKEKLWALGGFDEIYAPYYYEDADLGIRAWRAGWKCYFEPRSICMHAASSTIGKLKSEKVKIIIERNRILFNQLHLSGRQLRFFKFWLLLRCFLKLLKGNSTIYNAIKLFNKNLVLMEHSRIALRELQKKNNVNYSAYDIEQIILKEIKSISYRIF